MQIQKLSAHLYTQCKVSLKLDWWGGIQKGQEYKSLHFSAGTALIYYVGIIPGFPKSPRCILKHVLLTGLTHIFLHALKDV